MVLNLKQEILSGKIFIYPTDTVYGLGCNALNKKAVRKIKNIKKRDKNKPLSLIAPSFSWIRKFLVVDVNLKKYLPGKYTLILKKKNKNFLKHVSNTSLLGVRIPKNKFCRKIQESKVPFITTSVNLAGQKPASKILDINKEILNKVDFVIDAGKLSGKPSVLILGGKKLKRKC